MKSTLKHELFDGRCPKCSTVAYMGLEFRYCNDDCWDNSLSTEHLHWKCKCKYEWLTLCADHKPTDARP